MPGTFTAAVAAAVACRNLLRVVFTCPLPNFWFGF
jgi:hypothetical protein